VDRGIEEVEDHQRVFGNISDVSSTQNGDTGETSKEGGQKSSRQAWTSECTDYRFWAQLIIMHMLILIM